MKLEIGPENSEETYFPTMWSYFKGEKENDSSIATGAASCALDKHSPDAASRLFDMYTQTILLRRTAQRRRKIFIFFLSVRNDHTSGGTEIVSLEFSRKRRRRVLARRVSRATLVENQSDILWQHLFPRCINDSREREVDYDVFYEKLFGDAHAAKYLSPRLESRA